MKRLISWLLALTLICGLLPMSVFAVEVDTEGDDDMTADMWELLEGGSEANPLDLTADLMTEGDATATVTIPAGMTGYYIAYRVGGMNMTINDGEAVACVTDGMMYPYSWSITNDGETEAEYTIKVAFPVGHQQNPVVIEELGGSFSVAENSSDSYYFYTYKAAATGVITVYITNITDGVEGDIILYNQNTYEQKSLLVDGVDNYGLEVSMDVNEGDVVSMQFVTVPDENYNYPAADIEWYGSFAYPVGSEQNPVAIYSNMLDENGNYTVTVPAGETWNICAYYVSGMNMSINGGEAVVVSGFSYPFTITNDGEADAEYVINFTYPLGHQQNPEVIDIDYTGDIALADGDYDGYYYKYIAEEDGTINFNINTITEGVEGDITVYNQTSSVYVTLAEDGVDGVLTVEVAAGDEVIIQVVTNVDENYNNPAATINWTGAYEAAEPEIPVDENLVLYRTALSFQEYTGLQFIMKNTVRDNYDKVYAQVSQVTPDGVEETTMEYTEKSSYSYFNKDILSWSMTEEVTITLYAEKDGITYVGQSITTSVMKESMTKLDQMAGSVASNATYAAQCKILVDMLNYGAAVQTSFSHNVENLPNATLEEKGYNSLGTTENPTISAESSVSGTGSVTKYRESLSLQSKVELQVIFKIADMSAYKAYVTIGGETTVVEGSEFRASGTSYRILPVIFAPYKLRETCTVVICDADGNAVSPTYTYSVESLANAKLNGTSSDDVIYAMMKFGDSVAAIV